VPDTLPASDLLERAAKNISAGKFERAALYIQLDMAYSLRRIAAALEANDTADYDRADSIVRHGLGLNIDNPKQKGI